MKKIALVLSAVLSLAVFGSAQVRTTQATRTITNADLERYQQQRLAADRNYQETYAERGLPSPDEIDKRNEQRRKDLQELAVKLNQQDIARERLNAEIESRRYVSMPRINTPMYGGSGIVYSGGFGGFDGVGFGGFDGFGRFGFGHRSGAFLRTGFLGSPFGTYAAGGWVWNTPVGQTFGGFPSRIIGPGGRRGGNGGGNHGGGGHGGGGPRR